MAPSRKHWLDWQRGLAVLLMIEAHTLDAWLAPSAGRSPLRDVLTMIGGFAAPSFLFMAGLSQVLADAAMTRRGMGAPERQLHTLKRALHLLGVAYGFRLAEYLLGGAFLRGGGWQDILRVDILNVIAVGLAIGALVVVGMPRRARVPVAIALAAAVCCATPAVAAWRHAPNRALDYVFATYPRANFSFFNWAGFLFAGSAVGTLLLDGDRPVLLLGLGAALFAGGWAADLLPPVYAHQDFWITSPSWFAMRLGGVVALTAAMQLVPVSAERWLQGLTTLGRHSLLGYVASIELTYGVVSHVLRRALSLPAVLVGIVAMSAATWAISAAAERLPAPAGWGVLRLRALLFERRGSGQIDREPAPEP